MFHLLLCLFVSLAPTTDLQAQAGKSTITGRVTDQSGAVLQGAQVSVEPRAAVVVSNVQGQFFINNLDAGTYTITVSYVGFESATKTVEVAAGRNVTVEIGLRIPSQNAEVLVTAPRSSAEASAINIQRTSDNIVQVLPAEVIRSLPNANMADALGRLPSVTLERDEGEGKYVQIRGTEPRLTNTTIDGINVPSPESGVRQIKFDAIPADIVDAVAINKTLQANMDGDGIGGSVNLVTKTAGQHPMLNVSEMGGYTPIAGGRGLTETSATAGRRFGAEKRLGVLVGGTYDWNGRGIDDVEPVADVATTPGGSAQRHFESIDLRQYQYYRSRWGLTGSSDYQLHNNSNLQVRGLFSKFRNYGSRWVYSLTDNTQGIQLLDSNGCDTDDAGVTVGPCGGTPTFNNSIRRPDITIGNVAAGGKHVMTSAWLTWDVAGSRSADTSVSPGQASFKSTLDTSACQYDPAGTTNAYRPQFTPVCYAEAYDPGTMTLRRLTSDHGHTQQVNTTADLSAGKNYHLGAHASAMEIGAKFRRAHKYDDTYSDRLDPIGSIPMTQFPSRFSNSDFYSGAYPLGPAPIYEDALAFANANPGAFKFRTTKDVDPGNYDLVEKVSAGYVMNTLDFSNHARLLAGVRVEHTDLSTLSFDTAANTLSVRANGSYLRVLPSASLRYAFTPDTNIRLAYSRGLSRPDPQDIAQSVTFTSTGSPGSLKNTASLGNPNLKAETADNIDVLFERYLQPFGLVSGGFFYKNLSDPIVTSTRVLDNFQPTPIAPVGTYAVTQPFNAGSAWITGFEAAYTQHLSSLPGLLGGLGISANYGYTASRASGLVGRSDQPRLLRNAPNTWNVSPTYDRGRMSIRVGLSYNQANIFSYEYQDGTDGTDPTPGRLTGPFGDLYFYSHLQVDAQGSIHLGHQVNFVIYGLNLTDEVFGFYQGDPQFMIQREYYKPSVAFGLRWFGGR